LEDIVKNLRGTVKLAKLNIDKEEMLATSLNVKSIPAVFGVFGGKLIDSFVGLVDPQRLKSFIDTLLAQSNSGSKLNLKGKLESGHNALNANNIAGATKIFSEILNNPALKSGEPQALSGLVLCAIAENNLTLAEELIQTIKSKYETSLNSVEVKQAITALELAKTANSNPDKLSIEELQQKIQKNPEDYQAYYDLASEYLSKNVHDKSIDTLIQLLKKNKNWNEDAARRLLLKIFDVLGPTHPLTKTGRARFSSIWFL